jgi:hypothetical protein
MSVGLTLGPAEQGGVDDDGSGRSGAASGHGGEHLARNGQGYSDRSRTLNSSFHCFFRSRL